MSAFPSKADICSATAHVSYGPIGDLSSSILVRPCGSSPPLPSHNAAMIPDDLTSRIIAGRASDSASRVRA